MVFVEIIEGGDTVEVGSGEDVDDASSSSDNSDSDDGDDDDNDNDDDESMEVIGQYCLPVGANLEFVNSSDDDEKSSEDEGDEESGEDEAEEEIARSDSDDNSLEDKDDDNEQSVEHKVHIKPVPSATGEPCSFDLRNLLAANTHPIHAAKLYQTKKTSALNGEGNVTIPATGWMATMSVNEDYLLEKASDGCAQLIGALWQLPIHRSDAGPTVKLPSTDESNIPRALPLPPPKKETKWEKFSKERGIPLNKEKRSQKVWDEETGAWMYRHGYNKANNNSKEWPIMEVRGNEDPYQDPWERQREAKKSRINKNVENQMRNKERAGLISRGTTTRLLKNQAKIRQAGKAGGDLDRDNVETISRSLPSGVPVDLHKNANQAGPEGATSKRTTALRGKESTLKALVATQRSTASLGKFDKMRDGEPARTKAVTGLKKRKYETATDRAVTSNEAERSLKLLKAVVEGGGAEREKARRKGQLAKGETAYDYDYNDGLGPSSFQKKKGRAGAGKMRKMTKKRAK